MILQGEIFSQSSSPLFAHNNLFVIIQRRSYTTPDYFRAMGDCRIQIQYDATLERSNHRDGTKGREMKTLMDQLFASDNTVRELLLTAKINDKTVFQLISESKACLWDCTVYPPVDITKQFDATPTLFTAGWFPSARLQLLPVGKAPIRASSGAYDDEPDTLLHAYKDIQYVSRSGQLLSSQDRPSQLLQSAIDSSTPVAEDAIILARQIRNENRQKSVQKQKERLQRLQDNIQKLEQKSGKTSAQVRMMLIKSRASGRTNLIDRIHFKSYVTIDDDMTQCGGEDYRFFSPQDTTGKVVESFAQNRGARRGELLVATSSGAYLRLPVLMRLYEAKEAGYIEDFMTVVVRFYDTDTCIETPSIEEVDRPSSGYEEQVVDVAPIAAVEVSSVDKDVSTNEGSSPKFSLFLSDLIETLAVLDSKSKKGSSKPGNTTVKKVKQMQMKAKAKGDGKRVKLPDRMYFDLVVATKDCRIQKVEPVFMAQNDPLSRILRDHVGAAGSLLIQRDSDGGSCFDIIDDTALNLKEATRKGILTSFGRVIVYLSE